ncbi:cyanate lyase [Trichuris trichiura]|uniref:Cyanate lyase n=1 Tax=Trichuris trichiura TaxID=36087 RepID=A0A077ZFA0_TRITR|nr:cyanate lyase [Trichuris trichiura]
MLRPLLLNSRRSFVSEVSSILTAQEKHEFVRRILSAKRASGLSFDDIANRCQLSNVYCAQLFYNQAQLSGSTATKLKLAVPQLQESDLLEMQKVPMRLPATEQLQDPTIYRFQEVVLLYGQSLKAVMAEKFGDGIMSAIDFQITMEEAFGNGGEKRVLVKLNGKFLPHLEQANR